MSYLKSNEKAIDRGLDWLKSVQERVAEDGMLRILREATAYALFLHDHGHFGHRIAEDSHGWALVKDGKIVNIEVNEGHHGKGDARAQLESVAAGVSNRGYVGIVLASMSAKRNSGKPILFEIDFEMWVLSLTSDNIRENFPYYFKPIGNA